MDQLRSNGIRAGLVRIRLWRPFPAQELLSCLAGVERVVLLDRMLSPGSSSGPLGLEVQSVFYHQSKRPRIDCYTAGPGGRELSRRTFVEMVSRSLSRDTSLEPTTHIDVRHA